MRLRFSTRRATLRRQGRSGSGPPAPSTLCARPRPGAAGSSTVLAAGARGRRILKYALVRATTGSEERLFLVCLDAAGVEPVEGSWPALGMAASATLDVRFTAVALDLDAQVGPPGFYLQRPGFWFGGAGVAAVWLGGARAVARVLAERAGDDPHRLAHLGWVTARLVALDTLLASTADAIDTADSPPARIERLARILRAEVAESAWRILDRTGRATGAGPLSHDSAHARRAADLEVYIRQSHAEADLEALGGLSSR